jgi:hypothetical protein
MKIWLVTENDSQIRFYFFATKKEADAHAHEYRKGAPAFGAATVEPQEFSTGRIGLVDALNQVIRLTGFNGG